MASSMEENQLKSSAMSVFMKAYRVCEVVGFVRMPVAATLSRVFCAMSPVVDEDEVVGFQVERHGVRIARGVGFVRHRERADDVGGVQLDEVGRRQLERRQLCPRLRSDMRELAELVGGEDLDQGRLAAFRIARRRQRVRPIQVVNGCHGLLLSSRGLSCSQPSIEWSRDMLYRLPSL